MLLLACFLFSVGFYAMYRTSEKRSPKKGKSASKSNLKTNKWIINAFGLYLHYLAFGIFISEMGWASGILTGSICLMTFGGLIIILAPLKLFKYF